MQKAKTIVVRWIFVIASWFSFGSTLQAFIVDADGGADLGTFEVDSSAPAYPEDTYSDYDNDNNDDNDTDEDDASASEYYYNMPYEYGYGYYGYPYYRYRNYHNDWNSWPRRDGRYRYSDHPGTRNLHHEVRGGGFHGGSHRGGRGR